MKILRHRLVQDDRTPFPYAASPNRGGRLEEHLVLVMHYTSSGSAESAVSWLNNRDSGCSAHVVIGRDGSITQLVPFDRVAWHAGQSEWQGRSGVNTFSLGIELENAGYLDRHGDSWRAWFGKSFPEHEVQEAVHPHELSSRGWHVYTEAQLAVATEVATRLIQSYGLIDVVGHEDISPGRKTDPGPAFPMARFRDHLLDERDARPVILETTTELNIRIGPGSHHSTLPESPLPTGTQVELLDQEGSWRFVDVLEVVAGAMDLQGWVHGRYLTRSTEADIDG